MTPQQANAQSTYSADLASTTEKHALLPLPYDDAAFEPCIDRHTMQLHHDKHHATYVTNLNTALEKHPELQQRSSSPHIQRPILQA